MKSMMKQTSVSFVLALLFLLTALIGGCSSKTPPPLRYDMPIDPPTGASMLTANTYAGDAIGMQLRQRVNEEGSVLVASFAEMDNLNKSTAFGRTAMQQVASRVAQHGFKVLDIRLTDSMSITPTGEFMLSRNTAELLANQHNAFAVLVGVYTQTQDKLYVSLRVLKLVDSAVIAAYEYYLPLTGDVYHLLGDKNGATVENSKEITWAKYATRQPAFAYCAGGTPAQKPATVAQASSSSAPKKKAPPRRTASRKGPAKKAAPAPAKAATTTAAAPIVLCPDNSEPLCPDGRTVDGRYVTPR